MDSKNQKIKRPKRQQKVVEDYWDCSVCTFRNTAEAFKCLMCDVRKGKVKVLGKLLATGSKELACVDLQDIPHNESDIPLVESTGKVPKLDDRNI